MNIQLGTSEVGPLNPPEAQGTITTKEGKVLLLSRNGSGNYMVRDGGQALIEFCPDGMDLNMFCWWVNSHL
jgi:hypothetical protein